MTGRCASLAALVVALPALLVGQQARPAWRDPSLPVERRVDALLAAMTPEEKFWQLFMVPGDRDDPAEDWSHGAFGLQIRMPAGDTSGGAVAHARRIAAIQRFFRDSTRLGIPIIPFEEALHGVTASGATAFPQAIALAASWDRGLMGRVASAIAEEARTRGIRQVLSPVVNITRDPRWGRTEETYGEDPVLAGVMAVPFIQAFESRGIVTTPKHFVANVGDGGRDSWPIEASERQLREVWFPPFKAAIAQGGARSVMSAYNSVDGTPASQNRYLLTDVLRGRWGFGGVVISDAGATAGATVLHMTEASTATSALHAMQAGLDVVFQSSWREHRPWLRAFTDGTVPDSLIDRAVRRVLRLKFALGLFDEAAIDPAEAGRVNGSAAHRALAREAAADGMVLLRNTGVLPLASSARRIAVIGADADTVRLGGYSGPGVAPVSILAGLRRALPSSDVRWAAGPGRASEDWELVPASAWGEGLDAALFDNPLLEGEPRVRRRDGTINLSVTFNPAARGLRTDWYGVRWEGTLRVPAGRARRLAVIGDDGYRLYVDGRLVLDAWEPVTSATRVVPGILAAGSTHAIRFEFHATSGETKVRLAWDAGDAVEDDGRIAEAVDAARASDVAIVVAGLEEGEFRDRSRLGLPGRQEELIRRVAATGTPVVVVIVGGSAVTMPWLADVGAVVMAWYPGEEGGDALADVLLGRADPGGRLPITFPITEGQLPLWYAHKPTGRGNDYLDLPGRPLFPFGFGMSYARFRYDSLRIVPDTVIPGQGASVSFRVTNVSERPGVEVPQLYIQHELASVAQPVLALRDFESLHLGPGESRTVRFLLQASSLEILDRDQERVVEPGAIEVTIGRSSREMVLRGRLQVRQ